MFNSNSPFSDYVDMSFMVVLGISLVVLIGIIVAMVLFVVKYRKSKNPYPSNIEGNTTIEVVWTVIPLILFMGMFYLGWRGYIDQTIVPENPITVHVTGKMWAWSFQYENGVVTDTLRVPVNKPVKLLLKSSDVNHAFFIPAFRLKRDVIPNREAMMWFTTSKVDAYDVACAEYCGLQHSYMYTKILSLDSTAFEAWHKAVSAKQSKTYTSLFAVQNKNKEQQ